MKTYFEKKKGKFVPIGTFESMHRTNHHVLPIGWYLLNVRVGSEYCCTQKTKITPQRAELLCAIKEFQEILANKIQIASQMKMNKTNPISPKASKMWYELQKELGNTVFYIESASQIAEEAITEFETMIQSPLPLQNTTVLGGGDGEVPITNTDIIKEINAYFDKTSDKTLIADIKKRQKKFKEERR